MKNLTEFLSVCNSKTIPESEMNNFIREYTNDFDLKSLEYLRGDLNKFTDNIKFTLINETTDEDGSVEQQDRPTTVVSYLKTNKIEHDTCTPRQKVDLVLNDIENKKLNYYADESIFSYEIEQYLKFTDTVEMEYQNSYCDALINNITENSTPPPPPAKLTTELNQVRMKSIHQWLKENKYIDVDVDSWLYWFDLQSWISKKKKPAKIKWNKAVYHLTNVVYILCGNMNKQTETAMQEIFQIPKGSKFQKLTKENIQKDVDPYKSLYNMIEFSERNIKDLN